MGKIAIGTSGKIYLALHDGKYCIQKDYESKEISITKKASDDCSLTEVPVEPFEPEE